MATNASDALVLIIDPDPLQGAALARLLRFNNIPAESVADPSEALALLETRRPSLIILELDLPHLSGIRLIQALRKDPAYLSVPLLAWTRSPTPQLIAEATAAGAVHVLAKGTLGPRSILAKVREVGGV